MASWKLNSICLLLLHLRRYERANSVKRTSHGRLIKDDGDMLKGPVLIGPCVAKHCLRVPRN